MEIKTTCRTYGTFFNVYFSPILILTTWKWLFILDSWVAGWFLLQLSKLYRFSLGSRRAEIRNRRNVVTKRDDGNTAGCGAILMHIWTGGEIHVMQCQLTFASQLASCLLLTNCLVCDRMGLQEKNGSNTNSLKGALFPIVSAESDICWSVNWLVSSLYTGTTAVQLICEVRQLV